jgi:hypothetical protein
MYIPYFKLENRSSSFSHSTKYRKNPVIIYCKSFFLSISQFLSPSFSHSHFLSFTLSLSVSLFLSFFIHVFSSFFSSRFVFFKVYEKLLFVLVLISLFLSISHPSIWLSFFFLYLLPHFHCLLLRSLYIIVFLCLFLYNGYFPIFFISVFLFSKKLIFHTFWPQCSWLSNFRLKIQFLSKNLAKR